MLLCINSKSFFLAQESCQMLQLSICINPIIWSTHFWALVTQHKAMQTLACLAKMGFPSRMGGLVVMILYQLKWTVRTIKIMAPFDIQSYEQSVFNMLDTQISYPTAKPKLMHSTIQLSTVATFTSPLLLIPNYGSSFSSKIDRNCSTNIEVTCAKISRVQTMRNNYCFK